MYWRFEELADIYLLGLPACQLNIQDTQFLNLRVCNMPNNESI